MNIEMNSTTLEAHFVLIKNELAGCGKHLLQLRERFPQKILL